MQTNPWGLGGQELRIAEELAKGKCNKQIARELDCAESTVKAHLTAIFKKAGVYKRLPLALTFARWKWEQERASV